MVLQKFFSLTCLVSGLIIGLIVPQAHAYEFEFEFEFSQRYQCQCKADKKCGILPQNEIFHVEIDGANRLFLSNKDIVIFETPCSAGKTNEIFSLNLTCDSNENLIMTPENGYLKEDQLSSIRFFSYKREGRTVTGLSLGGQKKGPALSKAGPNTHLLTCRFRTN